MLLCPRWVSYGDASRPWPRMQPLKCLLRRCCHKCVLATVRDTADSVTIITRSATSWRIVLLSLNNFTAQTCEGCVYFEERNIESLVHNEEESKEEQVANNQLDKIVLQADYVHQDAFIAKLLSDRLHLMHDKINSTSRRETLSTITHIWQNHVQGRQHSAFYRKIVKKF